MCVATTTTATRRITRLAAKASPFHGDVTLYEFGGGVDEAGSGSVVKREVESESELSDVPSDGDGDVEVSRKSRVTKSAKPDPEDANARTSKSKKHPRRAPRSKPVPTTHPAPKGWSDVYAAIKAMRACVVAPVDTMGCDRAQWKEVEPKNRRFATLVSLMLSSQTKDEVTDAAVTKLRIAVGGSLSVRAVLDAEESVIAEAIAKVGFWRRKTTYIKQTAKRLHDDFDGDVPKTVEELCSLPGVGPKMAYLALQVAWKLNAGIGVDVHVHRITNRLGWHLRPTKHPEETRRNLESWLPKDLHGEINHMLVGFGQTICLPVGPKCGECTLSAGMCPSAQSSKTRGGKRGGAKTGTRASSRRSGTEGEGNLAGPKIEMEVEKGNLGVVPIKEETPS